MKKTLLIGATGKTGEAFTKYARNDEHYDLYLCSDDIEKLKGKANTYKVDATDKKQIKALLKKLKPEIIINCAAMNAVDLCESDKDTASKLNSILPEILAVHSKIFGSKLITFSTDYIFDGENGPYSEDDMPHPINYYGKSKLAGENAVRSNCENYAIIRTNVIYGPSSNGYGDFIRWLIDSMIEGEEINIVHGQFSNPTYVRDLARAIDVIVKNDLTGIYHVAGADYLSRYEIALKTAEVLGFNQNLIKAIEPSELKQDAARPERGGLIKNKAEVEFGIKFVGLKEGLEYIKLDLGM